MNRKNYTSLALIGAHKANELLKRFLSLKAIVMYTVQEILIWKYLFLLKIELKKIKFFASMSSYNNVRSTPKYNTINLLVLTTSTGLKQK